MKKFIRLTLTLAVIFTWLCIPPLPASAAAASLILSPASGLGLIVAQGKDFTAGSQVDIFFDSAKMKTFPEVVQTNTPSGGVSPTFSAVFAVPTTAPGNYEVKAVDAAGINATALFAVPSTGTGTPGPVGKGMDIRVLDRGVRFPATVLDAALNPAPGATVYLINDVAGATVQWGTTNAAGLLVMTAPRVTAPTWYRLESGSGSVNPERVMVLPGEEPPVPALKAEIAITNHNLSDSGAAGSAYVGGRLVRLFNPISGETTAITDGIGAFDAYLTYNRAGISMKAFSGVGPFTNVAAMLDTNNGTRANINGFQAGAAPLPPVELFRFHPWLTGSRDNTYTVTLHFNLVTRVGGGEVNQAAEVSKTFLRGDANSNGMVNITDALFIAQYLAGLRGLGESSAEVNPVNSATPRNDSPATGSTITIQDALYIAQMLAGLRDASYNLI